MNYRFNLTLLLIELFFFLLNFNLGYLTANHHLIPFQVTKLYKN